MGKDFNRIFSQIQGSIPARTDIDLSDAAFQDCQRDASAEPGCRHRRQPGRAEPVQQHGADQLDHGRACATCVTEYVHNKSISPEEGQKRLARRGRRPLTRFDAAMLAGAPSGRPARASGCSGAPSAGFAIEQLAKLVAVLTLGTGAPLRRRVHAVDGLDLVHRFDAAARIHVRRPQALRAPAEHARVAGGLRQPRWSTASASSCSPPPSASCSRSSSTRRSAPRTCCARSTCIRWRCRSW